MQAPKEGKGADPPSPRCVRLLYKGHLSLRPHAPSSIDTPTFLGPCAPPWPTQPLCLVHTHLFMSLLAPTRYCTWQTRYVTCYHITSYLSLQLYFPLLTFGNFLHDPHKDLVHQHCEPFNMTLMDLFSIKLKQFHISPHTLLVFFDDWIGFKAQYVWSFLWF